MKKIIIASAIVMSAAFALVSKKKDSIYANEPEKKNPMENKKVKFVEDENDKENADGERGHLEAVGEVDYQTGLYDGFFKRMIDIIISFMGLVILSPVYLIIAIAIKIDDPGPVFFTQKRVGKNIFQAPQVPFHENGYSA